MEYFYLGLVALLPTLASAGLYLVNKHTKFGELDDKIKQIIYGVVFGALAILGTEFGIPMNGAQVNCRDGAVITAGLLFGAPAGIIAGVIGGVERWIAVYWGVGSFTQVACSVSTIIAGVYSALLRKFMFEDKKPGFFIALAIGVVMEVLHLTMVFITNMSTPIKAMEVVKACTIPMVIANGLSVMFATAVLALLSNDRTIHVKHSKVRISQTIQSWLLVAVAIAFFVTSFFVYSFQDTVASTQTDNLLDIAVEDVSTDIISAEEKGEMLEDFIVDVTANRHVGETGYLIVVDEQLNTISIPDFVKIEATDTGFTEENIPEEDTTFSTTVNGEEVFCRYKITEGYYVVSVLPKAEALQMRNIALYVNTFMEILVFAVLFAMIYMLIKHVVVNQITSINQSLAKITDGDLGVVVDVRSNEEFASLSDDINSTVEALKRYIDEASKRIDQELEFAKNIQSSALPRIFPAFPKRKDFDIYASMNPAKEVGGDFYDFYMTNGDTLNFLVADVSGKGIPAAMFMMRAKTELKSLTETDMNIADVFTNSNHALCEGNDAGMFVTAWQGNIDLTNGIVHYANAGHNPPLVKHNGKFEYLRSKVGFVLAGMDEIIYKEQELQLNKGDVIFLYTDGVTEATNAQGQLYGEQRLLEKINSLEVKKMSDLCKEIKADVDAFVGDAPQFDDITMVAFKYVGTKPAPSISFDNAKIDDINAVTEFVEEELGKLNCPMKFVVQINVAIDEIFSNIVKYGYPNRPGYVKVSVIQRDEGKTVYIRFEDRGIPYNPLVAKDPDITLSAEEREIGGLGIYMVKKTMDDVKYKYENDMNILSIKKIIG